MKKVQGTPPGWYSIIVLSVQDHIYSESDTEESYIGDDGNEAIDNGYEAEDYCDDDDDNDGDETWIAAETLQQGK